MTVLKRLTSYPHAAVFDKAPADELVFFLSHEDGASWAVADGVMVARAGAVERTYDLSTLTVGQLADALRSSGYHVSAVAPEVAPVSALVLVEGQGDERLSNGNQVRGYTSLLWVLMGGYAGELREAGAQVVQALRQMVIKQSEGEWLDLWGRLYNEGRRQGESDASYAPRIPKEAFRLRESPIAIEEAVKDATGKTIRIEEPWRNIFRLDESTLSGPDKFADGSRVGYFLIQPTAEVPLDWADVLPVIDRNRAAGVMVLPPFSRNVSAIEVAPATVQSAITSIHTRTQLYEDRTLLDYSLIEDVPILNHAALHRQTVRHVSGSSMAGWIDIPWPHAPWVEGPYFVQSYYFRSYRVYGSYVRYESRYWPNLPWAEETWADYNVLIASKHTRDGASVTQRCVFGSGSYREQFMMVEDEAEPLRIFASGSYTEQSLPAQAGG